MTKATGRTKKRIAANIRCRFVDANIFNPAALHKKKIEGFHPHGFSRVITNDISTDLVLRELGSLWNGDPI
jgi:hypothetical protein